MLKVVAYKPEHYFMIHENSEQIVALLGLQDVNQIANKFLRGPAFTIFHDDEIIACGGIIIMWPGMGEAWAFTSPLVRKYPKFFHQEVKNHLEALIDVYHFVRVQAMVVKEFAVARKWAERLGFEYEGEMRKYMGGKDYVRYAIIREG